jgi:alanine racemase
MKGRKGHSVARATAAVIDLRAISHNIRKIRKRIGNKRGLMAVVKADGYGHSSVEVSLTALKSGADCLGIAIPEEAKQLRGAGIRCPVLVLGLIQPEEAYKVIDLNLEQTICSLDLAEALNQVASKAGSRVNVHIKVDTGMGRVGVRPRDTIALTRKIRRFRNLNLVGIFSHFSSADGGDKTFAEKQIEIFGRRLREIEMLGIKIPKKHMANSAGILDMPQSYFDLVRPGIMIYGLYPSQEVSHSIELKPAMTLKTKVIFLKWVPPGTAIGYGCTFTTRRRTRVATIPVGYADGYSRLLSFHGEVLIKGCRASLIGRVCMDMCMIDASHVTNIHVGDEVILFGEGLPVEEIAMKMGTINYEVVCAIGKRVPRIFIQ